MLIALQKGLDEVVDGGDCVFEREVQVGELVLVEIEAARGSESAFRSVCWERA